MPRKSASPFSRWSSRIASPRPMIRQPAMKPTVNTAVLRTSIAKRGSSCDQVGVLLQSHQGEVREQARPLAQRDPDGPGDETVNEDRHRHHRRQQQRDRKICLVAEHADDDQHAGSTAPARRRAGRSTSGPIRAGDRSSSEAITTAAAPAAIRTRAMTKPGAAELKTLQHLASHAQACAYPWSALQS